MRSAQRHSNDDSALTLERLIAMEEQLDARLADAEQRGLATIARLTTQLEDVRAAIRDHERNTSTPH